MFAGFLPFSRASFTLDLVAIAMWLVIPLLLFSVHTVRRRKNFALHKRIQISIASILGFAILLFEIDMRMYGWRQYAEPSVFFDTWLFPVFYAHLGCAITTTVLWVVTIFTALKKIPNPPGPSPFTVTHKTLGRWSAALMCLTAITGWIFYSLAFIF